MGTEVTQRPGLDLSRAPWQQWSADMVKLAKQTVLRDAKSDAEVYFCLALADALELNPFANEVYFIRRKGRDGDAGGVVPYVGREGLVKKAAERGAYFEADTVRENDEFEIVRDEAGERTCRHRYGKHSERGEIIGAYAFLHFADGSKPGFFYAPLPEFLPTFDEQWKMDKSPWGNQRSAMIEKCFDADTEVLTDRGFEPFAIAAGRVIQVTGRGLEATDARPFWQPYDGPMVIHASRELDFAVTPNHEMLLTGGRMEAREVYERARSRPVGGLAVPRVVNGRTEDQAGVTDVSLRLAGYYMADGHSDSRGTITFNLARERKLTAMRSLGVGFAERPGRRAGSPGSLTATLDAIWLRCSAEHLPPFILESKRIDVAGVLALSPRQARVFVDAWREFDGDARNRFYCTDPRRLGAFEVAAVHAGYSVSRRRSRLNLALSERPNHYVTLSERQASALRRWGRGRDDARSRGNAAARLGLEIGVADGRGVWCVTVPSGTIVVRRHGFSMLCANCAMIGAGRQRLNLAGVLVDAEVDRVQQQAVVGEAVEEQEFDWGTLDASLEVSGRLQAAVARVRELDPAAWPAAKLEMTLSGRSEGDLVMWAETIEKDAEMLAERARRDAGEASSEPAGDSSGDAELPGEGVTDAQVVDDDHVAALRSRIAELEDSMNEPGLTVEQQDDLAAEYDHLQQELKATEDPQQGTLGV